MLSPFGTHALQISSLHFTLVILCYKFLEEFMYFISKQITGIKYNVTSNTFWQYVCS